MEVMGTIGVLALHIVGRMEKKDGRQKRCRIYVYPYISGSGLRMARKLGHEGHDVTTVVGIAASHNTSRSLYAKLSRKIPPFRISSRLIFSSLQPL